MYERVPVCLFVNVCMWLFIYVHDVSGGEKLFAYLSIIVSHQVVPWGLLGSGTSSNKPQIAFNWEVLYGKCLWYSCLLLLFSHFWMWRPFVSVLLKDPWSSFSYSLLYWWRVFHRDAFLYSIITCACISPSSHPHTSYSHPQLPAFLHLSTQQISLSERPRNQVISNIQPCPQGVVVWEWGQAERDQNK